MEGATESVQAYRQRIADRGRQPGRTATLKQAEQTDGADSGDVESGEERSDGDSDVESVAEDEFAQFPDCQEEKEARADNENATPWDRVMLVVVGQEEGKEIRQRGQDAATIITVLRFTEGHRVVWQSS